MMARPVSSTRRSVAVIARLARPGLGDLLQRNIGLALLRRAWPSARITLYLSAGVTAGIGRLARPHLLIDDLQACPDPGLDTGFELERFVSKLAISGHDLTAIDIDSIDVDPQQLEAAGIEDIIVAADASDRSTDLAPGRYRVESTRPPMADLVDHAWALADALGLPRPEPAAVVPRLPFSTIDLPACLDGRRRPPVVVVHPGGATHWNRRWPARHYAELIDRLVARRGATVVLLGGTDDVEDLDALVARLDARRRARIHIIAGESLDVVATVMDRATLFVGNDSSMSHLAAALRMRCLIVAGPSHGDYLWGRAYPTMRTLTLGFPCRGLDERSLDGERSSCEHRCPLRYMGIDARSPECLERLGVDLVWTSVEAAFRASEVS